MEKDTAPNTFTGHETAQPPEELMRPFGFHMAEQRIQSFELQVAQGLGWVHQKVNQSDPDESQFKVTLPGSNTAESTKAVAEEIARRIQDLSPGWDISGSESGGKAVIIMQRRAWPVPDRRWAGFDVSDLQQKKLTEAGPAIEAAINAVHEQFSQFGRDPDAWEVPFPADGPPLFVLRQAAKRMQYYSADWIIEAHETPRRITGRRKPTPSVPAEVE